MRLPFILSFIFSFTSFGLAAPAQSRQDIDLSGPGWKLLRDGSASWKTDELFAPPVDLAKVPTNPPTGGWLALDAGGLDVSIPGTAEQYLKDAHDPVINGVTWWYRSITIPDTASPRHFILRFESARQRAEIYLDHKLVGYDLVGNTPFEVDISNAARPGQTQQLAVRITNPGGNLDWHDSSAIAWGKNFIPISHAFSGITGSVHLLCLDRVYLDDLYVQNSPVPTSANLEITARNTTQSQMNRDVLVRVVERSDSPVEVFRQEMKDVSLPSGSTVLKVPISSPAAKLWDLEHPNLYRCIVTLTDGPIETDVKSQIFGFRWFAPMGIGKDALFRLNGKRIVLRTAISWGFWPVSGLFPIDNLAEKQIQTAKAFGLNMLNFHRCIGQTAVLDKADELGLLYYEEPGGYISGDKDALSRALMHEKWLRMVKRDRSHPSLVIYTMINEGWSSSGMTTNKDIYDSHEGDLRAAHDLDPSRTILHTSAWASGPDTDDPAKMHMRPFDDVVHLNGWFDFHHAGGPEVWRQELYKNPDDFYARTDNVREIVYYGEEGAISTPPRLQLIKDFLTANPTLGWDGATYLQWYKEFDSFLSRKNLHAAFPSVDSFTTAMGAISLEHQGRKIENVRISNVVDGYAINGWEAETIDNHSGIVDCFRNPKADPAIMAYYNQPLYIAVKPRSQFVQVPGEILVDLYAVNELDLKGPHSLRLVAKSPAGDVIFSKNIPVNLIGGDTYGQLLAKGVSVPISSATGLIQIEATLLDSGKEKARGHDQILAVDWKSAQISGHGAVWEPGHEVSAFLKTQKNFDAPAYSDTLTHLDWVVIARPPSEGASVPIPADNLRDPSGHPGLLASFFANSDTENELAHRVDPTVDFVCEDGATPDPAVPLTNRYTVRWTGQILPPLKGIYTFTVDASSGVRLSINGQDLFDKLEQGSAALERGQIDLDPAKPAAVTLELRQVKNGGRCKLTWAVPELSAPDADRLLLRAKTDGTTLLLLDRAGSWMPLLSKISPITYSGTFAVGTTWLGGDHFVRSHPLFKDLPTDCGMNWPYQALVRDGRNRFGLLIEGEELVAGCYHSYPMALGTVVGIIPLGKGKVIFSTLDLVHNLDSPSSAAEVARKLFCNFLEFSQPR